VITDVHAHVIVPELTAGAGGDAWRPAVRAILGGNAARLLGLDADRAASAEGART
jgi:hypothetical protein